jgi:peptide/nickel transport system permease protein
LKLGPFLLKRILQSLFVLFGLSILIFVISRIIPGDPARMALGPRAPEEVVEELRVEMHLHDSLPVQYLYWIKGVVVGDFGTSLMSRRPVLEDIKEYLPATMELVVLAGLMMAIFAIILGSLAARYKDTILDGLIRVGSYFGIAIPAFVMAVFFVLIFGYLWPVIPVFGRLSNNVITPPTITGFMTIDSLIAANWAAFRNSLLHLLLPAIALSIGGTAQEARIMRASMVENLHKDFIAAERGYGISETKISLKYLLKPSLIPTISVMGLDIAGMVGNAFLVEVIFGWPGISRYGIQAMMNKDLNAISAVIILFGAIFVVINILVDLIVAFLDPRIRLGGVRGT